MERVRERGVRVVSRPSTRARKRPVTQPVFAARNVLPLSTPCVCALRGFFPERVFHDRTTRRHGLARRPHDWVGLAGRVLIFGGAAGEEGNTTFLGAMAVRQPASMRTYLVLFPFLPSAAGGAPKRQDFLSPAGSMADGRGHGDPPGVEVPGVGRVGTSPPVNGLLVDDRHRSSDTTDAGARGQRTLFESLRPGPDPTGPRPLAGAPREELTSRRPRRVLARISAKYNRPT